MVHLGAGLTTFLEVRNHKTNWPIKLQTRGTKEKIEVEVKNPADEGTEGLNRNIIAVADAGADIGLVKAGRFRRRECIFVDVPALVQLRL